MASKRAAEGMKEEPIATASKRKCLENTEDSDQEFDRLFMYVPRSNNKDIPDPRDDPSIGLKWDNWGPTRWNWGKKPRYLVDGEPDTNTLPSFLRKLPKNIKSKYAAALKQLSPKDPSALRNLPIEVRDLYEANKATAFSEKLSPTIRDKYESNKSVPFLKSLPPEIRLLIYSFVFERKTMHIAIRECLYKEKGSWSSARWERDHIMDFRGALADSLKFTHSICFDQDAELNDHDNSKDTGIDALTGRCKSHGNWGTYWSCHTDCLLTIRNKQNLEDHAPPCSGFQPNREPWCTDLSGEDYAQRLPSIARDHASSGLNLGLLGVCRQIHAEAGLIPFQRTTFAFREQKVMDRFPYHCLLTPQRDAIEHLRFDGSNTHESRLAASPFHNKRGLSRKLILKGLRGLELEVSYSRPTPYMAEDMLETSIIHVPEDRDPSTNILRNPVDIQVNVEVIPTWNPQQPASKLKQLASDTEELLQRSIRESRPHKSK